MKRIFLLLSALLVHNSAFAQFTSNPLSQALDNTAFNFVADSPGFVAQTRVFNFGGDAAASQPIGDNQIAVMATEFVDTFGRGGKITFDWKVSSETGFDILAFIIVDGAENVVAERQISGERGWETVSVNIPIGNYTLAWGYVKDSDTSRGSDSGYVDRVRITRAGEDLPAECRAGRTPLNAALDNDELEFTDFFRQTREIGFTCEPKISTMGGSAAISDASTNDSSQVWADVEGPVDLVFDWRVLSGVDNEMRVELYQGNTKITHRGNDYFGKIAGPTDWQSFRLRVPGGAYRVRWSYLNRTEQSFGLFDNVRIEGATADPLVLGVLPSIIELLNE